MDEMFHWMDIGAAARSRDCAFASTEQPAPAREIVSRFKGVLSSKTRPMSFSTSILPPSPQMSDMAIQQGYSGIADSMMLHIPRT